MQRFVFDRMASGLWKISLWGGRERHKFGFKRQNKKRGKNSIFMYI